MTAVASNASLPRALFEQVISSEMCVVLHETELDQIKSALKSLGAPAKMTALTDPLTLRYLVDAVPVSWWTKVAAVAFVLFAAGFSVVAYVMAIETGMR